VVGVFNTCLVELPIMPLFVFLGDVLVDLVGLLRELGVLLLLGFLKQLVYVLSVLLDC